MGPYNAGVKLAPALITPLSKIPFPPFRAGVKRATRYIYWNYLFKVLAHREEENTFRLIKKLNSCQKKWCLSSIILNFWLENCSKLPAKIYLVCWIFESGEGISIFDIYMQSYGMQEHGQVWHFMPFWRNRDFKINTAFLSSLTKKRPF